MEKSFFMSETATYKSDVGHMLRIYQLLNLNADLALTLF